MPTTQFARQRADDASHRPGGGMSGSGRTGAPQISSGRANPDASGRFVLTVRALAAAANALGLDTPSFKSPPRSKRLDRAIQRNRSGGCVVAVRVRGRPFSAVVADAIEGIVVCNTLSAEDAATVRGHLWRAATQAEARSRPKPLEQVASPSRPARARTHATPIGTPHPLRKAA